MTERASSEVEHVVVFVHGIEGHASDWDFAVPVFLSKHKDSVFVVRLWKFDLSFYLKPSRLMYTNH